MNRSLFTPLATLGVMLTVAMPALANDKYTGLPLAPSVHDNAPVPTSTVCNGSNHVRSSLFTWSTGTPAPAIAGWYENAMSGSKETRQFIHGNFPTVTEFIVNSGDGLSRVPVRDFLGKTFMLLVRTERPIDWGKTTSKNCKSLE